LETDKNYVNPYVELARIAAVESKWQEAADLTDHALELDPVDFPDGYYLNMLADYNLNQLDGAVRSARKLERLDSLHQIPQAFLILAAVLDRKRDFAGEADQWRQYLKCAPQAANVGEVRSRLQKLEKDKGQQADSSKTTETLR
jgi:tetratricopeptide (TPR) repeat protein